MDPYSVASFAIKDPPYVIEKLGPGVPVLFPPAQIAISDEVVVL